MLCYVCLTQWACTTHVCWLAGHNNGKGPDDQQLRLGPSWLQVAAIEAALGRTLTLWQGPPGTGKTATLVALLAAAAAGAIGRGGQVSASLMPRLPAVSLCWACLRSPAFKHGHATCEMAHRPSRFALLIDWVIMPWGMRCLSRARHCRDANLPACQSMPRTLCCMAACCVSQALAVAASNVAVDNLAAGLVGAGVRVVRLGQPVKVAPALRACTLEALMAARPAGAAAAKLRQEVCQQGALQSAHACTPASACSQR